MAFIEMGNIPRTGRTPGRKLIPAFDGGYCAAENAKNLRDNEVQKLCNMLFTGGRLSTRGGIRVYENTPAGIYHGMYKKSFCDMAIIHIGSKIYSFDGEAFSELFSFEDEDSTAYGMNGCVYFISRGGRICEIKSDLSASEKSPYIPLVAEYPYEDPQHCTVTESFNLMTRFVHVVHYARSASENILYQVPNAVDTEYDITVYVDGVEIPHHGYYVENTGIGFSKDGVTLYDGAKITLEYAVYDPQTVEENIGKIFGCTLSESYGGKRPSGTRIFLTGNKDHPGHYFRSELLSPLYFPDLCEEVLGDDAENVTCVGKRFDKLYMLTKSHIYSMSYEYDEQQEAQFCISEVSSSVGSDIPGSLCNIDNTLVFAHRNGVFILQSTDIFDEVNVKPLAGNILGEYAGRGGIFDGVECAPSCDHDRKYFVCAKDSIYVWDYDRTPYYDTGDSKKAQERLSWYSISGFDGCREMFGVGGKLFFIRRVGEDDVIFIYDPESNCDTVYDLPETQEDGDGEEAAEYTQKPIASGFMTKDFDLGVYSCRKRLLHVSFDVSGQCPDGSGVTLGVFGNGREFYRCRIGKERIPGRVRVRIPPYYADTYAFEFTSDGAAFGISDLEMTYVPVRRAKT